MKTISYIILFILITLLIGAIGLSAVQNAADQDKPPDPVRYTVTEEIDRRYTPPDTYEALYRTFCNNGLIIEQWREISREEYEEANSYENN